MKNITRIIFQMERCIYFLKSLGKAIKYVGARQIFAQFCIYGVD
jgi:hypothetical protein